MTFCDLGTSVPGWIIEHPRTLAVFQESGIDCSCDSKSLGYLCLQLRLDAEAVLARLLRFLEVDQQA